MKKLAPVPCPHCGGLVENLTCKKCEATFFSLAELCMTGCVKMDDQMIAVLKSEARTGAIDPRFRDALAKSERYYNEYERSIRNG